MKTHLADYLEGELSLDERALVDAHLDVCEECATEVLEMQQTIRLLRTLPEPEPPPMITANVMRRIRSGETQPGLLGRIGRALGGVLEPSFVLPASAIAAAALVFVVVQGPGLPDLLGPQDAPTSQARPGLPGPGADDRAPRRVAGAERRLGTTGVARPPAETSAPARDPRLRRPSLDAQRRVLRFANPGATPRAPEAYLGGRMDSAPGTLMVADRLAAPNRARAVAQSRAAAPGAPRSSGLSSGGEDPRDAWLARGLEDPLGLARYIADQNLAEQELWVSRLTDRAVDRGLLGELLEALRATGDPTADSLADDFMAEADEQRAAKAAEAR